MSLGHAHKLSDAYLNIKGEHSALAADYAIALRDLDALFPELDADADRDITWGEVREMLPSIQRHLQEQLRLRCEPSQTENPWEFADIERRSDGTYLRFKTNLTCRDPNSLEIDYRILHGIDATHKLVANLSLAQGSSLRSISPTKVSTFIPLGGSTSGRHTLLEFVPVGLTHIALGFDHLAFVLALVLSFSIRGKTLSLLACITAFTVGHSLTLAGAVLEWFTLPSWFAAAWVEPIIAASIGVAALLNLQANAHRYRPALALAFGLIHGLGFSGLLSEARIDPSSLPWALAGFNVGVELGQIVLVFGWLLFTRMFGTRTWFEQRIVKTGSLTLGAISLIWFAARLSFS